jgi:hypothetical protein
MQSGRRGPKLTGSIYPEKEAGSSFATLLPSTKLHGVKDRKTTI